MNVVQLRRNQTCCNDDLVRTLESALTEAKAGRSRSGIVVLMDSGGLDHVAVTGAYKTNLGALSNLGFRLQAMAAETGFG